jgi:hypothetical protein
MGSRATCLKEVLTIVNQGLQVIAILIAGVWGGWTWYEMNGDSLKTGINIDFSNTKRWIPALEACSYEILMEVSNKGKKTVSFGHEELQLYVSPLISLDGLNAHVGDFLNHELQELVHTVKFPPNVSELEPEEKYIKGLSLIAKPSGKDGFKIEYFFFDENKLSLPGFELSLEPCLAPTAK